MYKKNKLIFSMLTLLYFLSGFINIYFSYLAIACMAIPFLLLSRFKKNVWCTGICPRADYLSHFRIFNLGKKTPTWLFSDKMKNNIFMYFCINLMFIILSSFMVSQGKILPIEKIRLFIAFQLPWNIPQLWTIDYYHPLLNHLAFRFYSLMLSSALLGTFLAVVYKPRTWCVICPVKTLSSRYLTIINTEKEVINE
ncbi:MAG: hypothetical protein PF518_01035 [Spirochaetaceae bacterium]|jgi:hypothetical protein|nr:hypothetical protein [Spirochaetaceae bacterium]